MLSLKRVYVMKSAMKVQIAITLAVTPMSAIILPT